MAQPRIARPRVDRPWIDYLIGVVIGLLIALAFFGVILIGLMQGLRGLE
jgi:hypothetical protein